MRIDLQQRVPWAARVAAAALALCLQVALAGSPRVVGWDALTMRLSAADNPFATLAPDQLEALADVAALRDRKARGVVLTDKEAALERAGVERLRKAGLDADRLLAQREGVASKQRALEGAVNTALDGQEIRLAGYLLPLEFTGKAVSEFLLVPWAGACIHTPPPPANQVILVRTDKPYPVKAQFDAVWITGRLTAKSSRRTLYITDGDAAVDAGYAMHAAQVEPFKP